MQSRASTRRVVRVNSKHFLGVALTIDGTVDSVGSGDDGEIIKFRGDRALKFFAECTVDDYSKEAKNWIRRDQVAREFTALSIIKAHGHHPNFPKLYSTEVDEVTLTKNNTVIRGWAVQMELINNQATLFKSLRMWGMAVNHDTTLYFDMELRGRIMKHVIKQLKSVVDFLGECGIHHRDLDECNVLVRFPDIHVFIVDFSRASFPDVEVEFQINPMPEHTAFVVSRAYPVETNGCTADMIKERNYNIRRLYSESYCNAYRSDERGIDPTDKTGVKVLIENMVSHMNSMSFAVYNAGVPLYNDDPEKASLLCQDQRCALFSAEGQRLTTSMNSMFKQWDAPPPKQRGDSDYESSDESEKVLDPFVCNFGDEEIVRMQGLMSCCGFSKFDDSEIDKYLNMVVNIEPSDSYRNSYNRMRASRRRT